ncbi:MAG: DNA mismatch repair endonuclease MutL [Ruminococcus sp.]|nr:DNA mismatch repair endonuclease MutL [Ruminococcus sp.]
MAVINVLSKEISELIAAGEVIERPSSVIKELVENSIDSGARHITVEIKNGGTTYMRVTDDGCGMSYDDVPKAFLRHATSKISEKDDLDNIMTLGFRGEALASVAAVSRVELMTKQSDETYGTLYNIEGSVETLHDRGGCPDGTTIIIRDLFYNVPARRKFMKKDVTEANAVSQILQKITMSHPDIAFRFIRDNRTEFSSSGDGELFSAVYAVYGRDFARDLITVDYEYEGIRVSGFTVKPLYSKTNRAFQNFFVNGRYVKSKLCSAALENAYTNMIMTGKFPACVMLIDLPPATMDVNIHPAKAEVRFTNEKAVSDAVYYAVKNALMAGGLLYEFELKPRVDWTQKPPEEDKSVQQEFMFTPVEDIEKTEKILTAAKRIEEAVQAAQQAGVVESGTEIRPAVAVEEKPSVDTIKEEKAPVQTAAKSEKVPAEPVSGFSYINSKSFMKPETVVPPEEKNVPEKQSEWTEKPKIRVIGEAFGVYIIAETEDKTMLMIDKHAAHERIIFEQLKSRNCRQYSQMLMTGIRVLLTADEFSAMETNAELLEDMGFVFDFTERPCVVAKAVPTFIMEQDMEEIISEIADNLRLHRQNPQSRVLDDMLHSVACKAAIRGNDKNDITELQALAEQVYGDEKIRHCPHGRPVIFTMSKSSIERQFGRA